MNVIINWPTVLSICGLLAIKQAGWFATASADGKLEPYEWKKLTGSSLKIVVVGVAGAEFFQGLGIDINVFTGVMGALLIEFLYDYKKKFFPDE